MPVARASHSNCSGPGRPLRGVFFPAAAAACDAGGLPCPGVDFRPGTVRHGQPDDRQILDQPWRCTCRQRAPDGCHARNRGRDSA